MKTEHKIAIVIPVFAALIGLIPFVLNRDKSTPEPYIVPGPSSLVRDYITFDSFDSGESPEIHFSFIIKEKQWIHAPNGDFREGKASSHFAFYDELGRKTIARLKDNGLSFEVSKDDFKTLKQSLLLRYLDDDRKPQELSIDDMK